MPTIITCHTVIIPTPAGGEAARLMQHKDIINAVIRLLHSWNEPLEYLAQEAHLPKFNHSLSCQAEIIADENHQLQEITSQIANQFFDPKIAKYVDYALWPGHQSFKSFEEQTRPLAVYNTLRCLFNDTKRINNLLQFLKCQESTDNSCKSHLRSF
ncbi:Prolactin [Fukomys damarensis]|uniref:Prolactin n=2 Tax=Fukomys damarensis TaxID=885580 RepID=A0A091DDA5_FUKDA|nr:Prolactin [Fukomys damarensis]